VFGLVKPCSHRLGPEQMAQYRAHMCGACLALRGETGQLSRMSLNQDALILGLLIEHFGRPDGRYDRVAAGRCALRGMRPATVLDPASPAARYAAAVSLLVLHAGVSDHATDRDRGRLTARLARPATAGWQRHAERLAPAATAALRGVRESIGRDAIAPHRPGLPFDAYIADTEAAFGHAFAGVAAVAEVPGREADLRRLGEAFGRIAVTVDAVEDYAEDLRRGAANPLVAAWPEADGAQRRTQAARIVAEARAVVDECLTRLEIPPSSLAGRLLHGVLGRRVRAVVDPPAPSTVDDLGSRPAGRHPRRHRPALSTLVAVPLTGLFCCDGCDCDCGCCECDGCDCCCTWCDCCNDCSCCDDCDCCERKKKHRIEDMTGDPAEYFRQPRPPGQ
jgi:hypothetical protein